MSEPIKYHISVGSATSGVHFNMDIEAEDPKLYPEIDKFLETWMKTQIAQLRNLQKLKGG